VAERRSWLNLDASARDEGKALDPDRTAAQRETARLELFSDGVFAIAITILALELRVPHLEHASAPELASALLRQWPSYFAFLLSFATILISWIHHHWCMEMVERVDAPLMLANGFLLLMTAVLFFPTALVSEYLTQPGGTTAVATYALVILLTNVAWNLFAWAISPERGLLKRGVPPEPIAAFRRRSVIAFPIYLTTALVTLANVYVGVAALTAMWLYWGAMIFREMGDRAARSSLARSPTARGTARRRRIPVRRIAPGRGEVQSA
jgi:uncharacterized membrane protein